MRNTLRMLTLVLVLVSLLGGFALTASASDLSDYDSALGYLDGYADNVGVDENFDANIRTAMETVRQDVSSYATFLSLLPPVIAIALALITKEVYSSLFIGILSGALI